VVLNSLYAEPEGKDTKIPTAYTRLNSLVTSRLQRRSINMGYMATAIAPTRSFRPSVIRQKAVSNVRNVRSPLARQRMVVVSFKDDDKESLGDKATRTLQQVGLPV
jgi:hypothetical protein